MLNDPRKKNILLNASSIATYKADYASRLAATLDEISAAELQKAADAISKAATEGRRVYVAGNGGSAAIAEHLCCDWTKGTHCEGHPPIATQSLTSNVALYSAIANDYGFENVFSTQMGFFGKPGDVLIAISSSGSSPNIIKVVEAAKSQGIFVVGFSGFSGGKLAEICDASIHAAVNNYGLVEDCHQAVMHIIAQFVAHQRDTTQHA